MLTSSDGVIFPEHWHSTHRLDTFLKPDQIVTVERCLRFTYQGLQWAIQHNVGSQLQKKRSVKHRFQSHLNSFFLIEDDYIIGIFKYCHGPWSKPLEVESGYPKTLQEYLEFQTQGKSLIVSEVVLEKETRRLANRRALNQQPRFIREVAYPALMGVVTHYSGYFEQLQTVEETPVDHFSQTSCSTGVAPAHCSTGKSDDGSVRLPSSVNQENTNQEYLTHIFLNTKESTQFWLEHSPLSLFYDPASPFHIECPETRLLRETSSVSNHWLRAELMCDAV
ncbi:MAG: hypothetical protein HC929_00765 [Leptolyngbyaceae cyanobacterium SM2_5_2]|nr:hypothetical protein [Leptolyngbyaceae cyanobacterium SM2_5_2]